MSVEALSGKVGGVLIVLGLMHFFNLYALSRLRKRAPVDAMTLEGGLA